MTYSNVTVNPPANDVYVLVASATLADGYGLANGGAPDGGWLEGKGGPAYNGPIEKVPCEPSGGDGDNSFIDALIAALIRILLMILASLGG